MKMNDVWRDIQDSILKPIGEFLSLRYQTILVFANFLALALGTVYLLDSSGTVFWNIFAIFMVTTLLGNLVSVAVGGKYSFLDYGYLLLSMAVFIFIPLANTGVSFDPSFIESRSILSNILLLSLFVFGGVIAYIRIYIQEKSAGQPKAVKKLLEENKVKDIVKIVLIGISLAVLLTGVYVSYDLLTRNKGVLFEVFIPGFSLFLALFFITLTLSIVKLGKNKTSLFNLSVLSLGLLIFAVCMLPFMAVQEMIVNSERSYLTAFGPAPKNFSTNKNTVQFKEVPFSLPDYLFGTYNREYTLIEDVVFYEGKNGVDNGIKLRFDVYLPPKGKVLPGGNSILVRFHGGAWTIGDKSSMNFPQVNKYFASLGYVVFDVQYGLNNTRKKFVDAFEMPENVGGDFRIDDMLRHAGMFFKYLKQHYSEYGANIDSVFLSGNSAGGQLACAAGLALSSGKHSDLLPPQGLKIKGLILLYPANGLSKNMGIDGTAELADPALMAEKNSPPCLVFHGEMDGFVDPKISQVFREAYIAKGNTHCAVLTMPLAGHGSDFYFSGFYNQIFTYYMERFMYLYK
ncbi:MAG: hypothetical protein A2Y33_01350 [Spirochaetes bacterium GWF1_51_8]|nr:MAG: hypothetical protein A2Y33_01350 [Spirochaetes bacterium GWF1_51_8]